MTRKVFCKTKNIIYRILKINFENSNMVEELKTGLKNKFYLAKNSRDTAPSL